MQAARRLPDGVKTSDIGAVIIGTDPDADAPLGLLYGGPEPSASGWLLVHLALLSQQKVRVLFSWLNGYIIHSPAQVVVEDTEGHLQLRNEKSSSPDSVVETAPDPEPE